jgi:glutamine---fructose-6-phosphate transaminase (isomerizing)
LTPKTRREVLECLVTGLKRLEYRGYDSAGVAVDTNDTKNILLIKSTGKVKVLEEAIAEQMKAEDIDTPLTCHVGISHTRWATHGSPSDTNSHPHRSDLENTFVVVHNGIVTNYKDLKTFLEKRGYVFESETDTEIIAKLIHHLYLQHPSYSFRELVEQVINQLVRFFQFSPSTFHLPLKFQEGAFALAFKSKYFPGECVATRRGSPLLLGIKTKTRLATDHIPILYGKGKQSFLFLLLCR